MSSAKKLPLTSFTIQKRLSSASIHNLGNQQCLRRKQSLQKTNLIERMAHTSCIKRNKLQNNFVREINIPEQYNKVKQKNNQYTFNQKHLIKSSDKMKLVYFSKQDILFPNVIVISVDFIINEDCFWSEESIKPNCAKDWRNLQKVKTIFWVIRRKSTLEKLKEFTKFHQLRLDAVFLIKRLNNYTVNYNKIISSIPQSVRNNPKAQVVILQCVKVNQKDVCDYQSYRGRIPIIFCKLIKVKFGIIRADHMEGLEKPIQFINQLCSLKTNLFTLLQPSKQIIQFIQRSQKEYHQKIKISNQNLSCFKFKQQFKENEQSDEQIGIHRLQEFKRNLIQKMCRTYGRQHKIDGNSIHYFIGDFIKRNYNKLVKQMSRCIPKGQKQEQDREIFVKKNPEEQATTVEKQTVPMMNNLEKLKIQVQYYQFY